MNSKSLWWLRGRVAPLILKAGLALFVGVSAASATTILTVSGPNSGLTAIGENVPNDGVSQSFTSSSDITDATISFGVSSCGSCSGSFTLMTGVPNSGALLSDLIFDVDYEDYTSGSPLSFALTDVTLEADQLYSMIFTITSGNGIWSASGDPSFGGTGEVTPTTGYQILTDINPNFILRSSTEDGPYAVLQFTLTRTVAGSSEPIDGPAPVPLPAAGWMLLAGVAGLAALRRKAG